MTRTHSYDKLPFVLFEGDSEVGHTLGRYVLHDELACGGMGAVYLGRLDGPAGFSRTVAIKRLHPHLARDPEFAAMFLDEARLAARIAHPNVVPTLDVVQSADALLVVMEYVHGESLAVLSRAARKRGERLPMGVATSIVIDVLDGLHAAHEAKDACGKRLDIVHRDVSPHNVMVGRDGLARVVDFGVAKAASKIYASSPGQVRGKLAYMAPEQMLGEAIDRRADVFAASIVLWELLTGARLFDSAGVGAGAAAFGAVIDPPSMRVSAIPEALDAIVLRGLARDAGHRFATAHEMARALEEATLSARRAEVGEWVERTAGDALRLRASRIEHIGRAAAPPSRARQMSESAIATDPVALESHPQSARSDAEE